MEIINPWPLVLKKIPVEQRGIQVCGRWGRSVVKNFTYRNHILQKRFDRLRAMKRSTSTKVSQVWGKEERSDTSFQMAVPLLGCCCGFVGIAPRYSRSHTNQIGFLPSSTMVMLYTSKLGRFCGDPDPLSITTWVDVIPWIECNPILWDAILPSSRVCPRGHPFWHFNHFHSSPRPKSKRVLSVFRYVFTDQPATTTPVFSFSIRPNVSHPKFDNARLLVNWPAW